MVLFISFLFWDILDVWTYEWVAYVMAKLFFIVRLSMFIVPFLKNFVCESFQRWVKIHAFHFSCLIYFPRKGVVTLRNHKHRFTIIKINSGSERIPLYLRDIVDSL